MPEGNNYWPDEHWPRPRPDMSGLNDLWRLVACPTCHAPIGLACEDADGYRQPDVSHEARVETFYDFTEQRGQ